VSPVKQKKGFTLIEILVALVLVGLVSAMAYSLLLFSNRMLSNSNKHYDIQNDIRLASTYVAKELRFATELEIVTVAQSETDIANLSGYNYIYIKNGRVNQAIFNTSNYTTKPLSQLISGTESSFVKDAGSNNVLNLTLTANQTDKKFSVSTAIVLENFPLISPALAIVGTNGLAVKYKTRAPHATLIPVSSITITGLTAITALDGKIDLDVTILPDDASIKSVVWSSDDPSVASVDAAGVVQAQNNGVVTITALAADGSGRSDTHVVTVSGQLSTPTPTVTPSVAPSPTPVPTITPSVTPIPTPTPLPAPEFTVSVVGGVTNTANSFDVNFSRKVDSIQFIESNNASLTFSHSFGSKSENATLKLSGAVLDNDWLIIRFNGNGGKVAVVKFTYTAATKWVKSS